MIKISENPQKPKKKLKTDNIVNNTGNFNNVNKLETVNAEGKMSQAGKTPEEVLPFLLSGESDDLSFEFLDKL